MNAGRNWLWTWDWSAEDDANARIVYFRRTLALETVPEALPLRISADSRYKLYVNGCFVQEGPQKALDLREWFVDTAQLAPYLKEGENVLAVEVLRYGARGTVNDSLLRSKVPCLYTAARRGHQVILCEKENALGGILKSEQALPFKYEMYQLAGTYAKFCRDAGVEIRLNTEVNREYVEKEAPDALIIAVGSKPLVPPIPGLDGENVVVVNNYYLEKDKVGDDVVVMGGGLAGSECAIHLGQEGKSVHLVEMRDALAPDANVRHRPLLLAEIDKYVHVHTGYRALRVTEDGVVCADKEGKEVLVPGKSVICALGQRSRTDVVENLEGTAPFVRVIGDASRVSTITNAVYWGYHAALDI